MTETKNWRGVDSDRNIFSIKCGTKIYIFSLYRGLVYHHHRIKGNNFIQLFSSSHCTLLRWVMALSSACSAWCLYKRTFFSNLSISSWKINVHTVVVVHIIQSSSYISYNRRRTYHTVVVVHIIQSSSYISYSRRRTYHTIVVVHIRQSSSYISDNEDDFGFQFLFLPRFPTAWMHVNIETKKKRQISDSLCFLCKLVF